MSTLTGARPLATVVIAQDRRNIAPWVMLISVLSTTSIIAYRWIFPDLADRRQLAGALSTNPALELVFGPARDLLTNDGFNAWRAGMLGAFFAGLMAILVVVRNFRADEDSGNAELIASGVITRQARLLVAVLAAVLAALALGVVCTLLTVAFGGQWEPMMLIAATFTCSALVFAGVAAVTCQLGSDAPAASSMAIAVLGLGYVLRGRLDSSGAPDWTWWLTPFGWLEHTRPATENLWWPLAVPLVAFVLLVLLVMVLQQRRDFGQGLVATRPGPSTAPRLTVWGLAWRLTRGQMIVWLLAFGFLGMVFGTLAGSMAEVIGDSPDARVIMANGVASEQELRFGFVATILQVIGIVAAVAGVQVVMRHRAEETAFRAEPLLAMPLRRGSHLAASVVVATFALTLLGPTFKLPEWALDISPLHHVPVVVAASSHWWELAGLGAVACLLLLIGFAGYRRRDIG